LLWDQGGGEASYLENFLHIERAFLEKMAISAIISAVLCLTLGVVSIDS